MVTIDAGGQMSLVQDARVTVAVGGLAVAEASGGGRLDLGAGQVSIAAGGITAADLRADIIAGRNGGAWNGATGIMSSTAAIGGGTRAVGYVVNGDGSATVSFAAPGDIDLSGPVNVFDLVGINSCRQVWHRRGQPSGARATSTTTASTNVFDLVGDQHGRRLRPGQLLPGGTRRRPAAWRRCRNQPAGWAGVCAGCRGLAGKTSVRAGIVNQGAGLPLAGRWL